MPLQTYDTRDAVPEAQRESAIETKDGKFVVSEDEDVTPLKVTIEATRKEAALAKKEAKRLADELATLHAEAAAGKAGLSSEKLAEIRKQAEEKFRADIEERDRLRGELRALRLDSAVKGMLAKADAVDVDDAWRIVGGDFDLTEDGKPVVKDDPTADIEKYVASIRTKKPHLFKGTLAVGGGAAGQQRSGAPDTKGKPVTQWTPDEKQAYRDQHGDDAIQKLFDDYIRDAVKPK